MLGFARDILRLMNPCGLAAYEYGKDKYKDAVTETANRCVDSPYGQQTRQRVMPSTNFVVDVWTRRSATLTGAAIAHTYNIRPIQKLARHTEDSKHQDQPPSDRTKSKPHGIPGSLNLLQQVIQENEET